MKRFLLALASLALLSVTVFSDAALAGRVIPGHQRFEPLKWRSYLATGNVDSLYATLGPMGLAAGSVDTSETFSLTKMSGPASLHTTATTSQTIARVWLYSPSSLISASADSLALVTVQVSNDGSTWFTALSGVGIVLAGAGNRLGCVNLTDASGATPTNSGVRIADFQMARLIVGGTANLFPQTQILLAYYDVAEPALYSGEDQSVGKWKVDPIKWVSNSIDSTSVALVEDNSAVTSVVSKGVSMDDKATWKNVVATTGGGTVRAVIERTSNGSATVDSIYAAVEVSVDGTNWTTWSAYQGSPAGFAGATSNTYAYDVPLTDVLTANTGAAAGQNQISLVPFIRVRAKLPLSETKVSTLKLYLAYMPAY